MTVFEVALMIAEGIAQRKEARLNGLTFHPLTQGWTGYFGNDEGGHSYVIISHTVDFNQMLEDYDRNWMADKKESED